MTERKVNYMNVISDTCSVRRVIIVTKYAKFF